MNTKVTFLQKQYWDKPGLVHLPADYDSPAAADKLYPLIWYIGGRGEQSADRLTAYGPSKLIQDGHSGAFVVNGVNETPIIISVATGLWPQPSVIDLLFTEICSRWRIDKARVYVTGLSMGAGSFTQYAAESPEFGKNITAIYALQSAVNVPGNRLADNFGAFGGKWAGVEGANDQRDMEQIYKAMNAKVPGSAIYFLISQGPGTEHCCWERFYGLDFLLNGDYYINWLLKQKKGATVPPPPPPDPTPVPKLIKTLTVSVKVDYYDDGSTKQTLL